MERDGTNQEQDNSLKRKNYRLQVIVTIVAVLTFIFGGGVIWKMLGSSGEPSVITTTTPTNTPTTMSADTPMTTPADTSTTAPTDTPTTAPTDTPTTAPTDMATTTPTDMATTTPTDTPKATPTDTSTTTPPDMPKATPTDTPTTTLTDTPMVAPTDTPTTTLTDTPTVTPTDTPTIIPTDTPATSLTSLSTVVVPLVVGREQIEATEMLVERGLEFQVWWTEKNNISANQYRVIDQSIPAGSSVPEGSLVKLELEPIISLENGNSEASDDEFVSVPMVIGMEQTNATDLLTALGLNFQVWWTEENNIPVDQYRIINQSIPVNAKVPKGTLVKLELEPIIP